MKVIARVFPRRTKATPDDELSFSRFPILSDYALGITEVHVSVAFEWDTPLGRRLQKAWSGIAPAKIGGPAFDEPGGEFTPGMYLRHGYTITSRGCPRRCKHCRVHIRDGQIRQLQIKDGWIVQDDNLIACTREHKAEVFAMLKRQPKPANFTGGLDCRLIEQWDVDRLAELKGAALWFSYDMKDQPKHLERTARMLFAAGFTQASHRVRCYVLIGEDGDTVESAESRLQHTITMGYFPQAMLFNRRPEREWRQLQRAYANPVICGFRSATVRGQSA
jgi:hypothetical protein